MTGSVSKLWPDVGSPVARRVLVYLFNLPGSYTDSDFLERMYELDNRPDDSSLSGVVLLWRMIQDSDVCIFLAGGPELTPDITEKMPDLDRMIYRLVRPRNLEQRVREIVNNLEWYIDPVAYSPASISRGLSPLLVIIPVILVVLSVMGSISLAGNASYSLLSFVLTLITVTLLVTSLLVRMTSIQPKAGSQHTKLTPVGNLSISFNARATVLYHYLRREFGEGDG